MIKKLIKMLCFLSVILGCIESFSYAMEQNQQGDVPEWMRGMAQELQEDAQRIASNKTNLQIKIQNEISDLINQGIPENDLRIVNLQYQLHRMNQHGSFEQQVLPTFNQAIADELSKLKNDVPSKIRVQILTANLKGFAKVVILSIALAKFLERYTEISIEYWSIALDSRYCSGLNLSNNFANDPYHRAVELVIERHRKIDLQYSVDKTISELDKTITELEKLNDIMANIVDRTGECLENLKRSF